MNNVGSAVLKILPVLYIQPGLLYVLYKVYLFLDTVQQSSNRVWYILCLTIWTLFISHCQFRRILLYQSFAEKEDRQKDVTTIHGSFTFDRVGMELTIPG